MSREFFIGGAYGVSYVALADENRAFAVQGGYVIAEASGVVGITGTGALQAVAVGGAAGFALGTSTGAQSYFGLPTQEFAGQSFIAAGSGVLTSMKVRLLRTTGVPSDQMYVEVFAAAGDLPTGPSLGASSAIQGSALLPFEQEYTLLFPAIRLTAGQKYCLVFARSGALHATQNFAVECSTTSTYADGMHSTNVSGVWGTIPARDVVGSLAFSGGTLIGTGLVGAPPTGALTSARAYLTGVGEANDGAVGTGALQAVELSRINVIRYSEDWSSPFWQAGICTAITANAGRAPDGTMTADEFADKPFEYDSYASVAMNCPYGITLPGLWTLSVYVKLVRGATRYVRMVTNAPTRQQTYDIVDGYIQAPDNSLYPPKMEYVGDGWWRLSMAVLPPPSAQEATTVNIYHSENLSAYHPVGNNAILIWGAQFQPGSVASLYSGATVDTPINGPLGWNRVFPSVGSGMLVAQSPNLSGFFKSGSVGTGALTSTATLQGVGQNGWLGAAALAASSSVVAGTGTAMSPLVSGDGALAASATAISGNGFLGFVGSGALTAVGLSRTNYLWRSQEFDITSGWSPGDIVVTPNAVLAPDGTMTAETIADTVDNKAHYLNQTRFTQSAAAKFTYSIYAKAGTSNWLRLNAFAGSGYFANFNLGNGTVGSTTANPVVMTPVGDGWYRCSITFTGTNAGVAQIFCMKGDDLGTAYVGTGATVHIWGAQFEYGGVATAYIPTTGSTITIGETIKGVGVTQFVATGALKAGAFRQNLYLRSEDFGHSYWNKYFSSAVADAVAAPNSTMTAETITSTSSNGAHGFYVTSDFPTATIDHAISYYFKAGTGQWLQISVAGNWANFDVLNGALGLKSGPNIKRHAITNVGNGWYRCEVVLAVGTSVQPAVWFLTGDTSGSAPSHTSVISFHVWGAQCEPGSVATAYIPTTSAPVTVGLENAPQIVGAGFSSATSTSAALQATMPPLTMGGGITASTGTGDLAAQSNVVAGAGLGPSWVGSGALVASAHFNTNLLGWSEAIDQPQWQKTDVVVTANDQTAPNNTLTADRVADVINSNYHFVRSDRGGGVPGTYTLSIYAKAGTLQWLKVYFNGGTEKWANFDLINGVVGLTSLTQSTRIEALPDGWYRCSVTAPSTMNGGAISGLFFVLEGNTALVGYSGTGRHLWMWGAQLEMSSAPTAYIPTLSQNPSSGPIDTLVGRGASQWLAAGALPAGLANLAGAGLTRWMASGSITAQLAALTGYSVSMSLGSGALVASDTAAMDGVGWAGFGSVGAGVFEVGEALITSPIGTSSSSGVGALTSSATVAAIGVGSSGGSGALVVPGVASVAGVGVVGSVGTAALNAQAAAAVGDGVNLWVATGALTAQRANAAAIGLVEQGPEGPGVFVAQAAKVVGVARSEWIVTGSLDTRTATMFSSGGFVRWSGPGILVASGSAVAGEGISSSRVTMANLFSSRVSVEGIEGIEVVLGLGDPRSQSAQIVSFGGILSQGTGALQGLVPAVINGDGVTRSQGTGAPISRASVVTGEGVVVATGAGLVLAASANFYGVGIIIPAPSGTGVLASNVAALGGVGIAERVGTGELWARVARVNGVGVSRSVADGELAAGVASVAGVAVVSARGTGTIAPARAAVEGNGISSVAGSGSMPSRTASLTGHGVATQYGTGEIVAGVAKVSGAGIVEHRIAPQTITAQAAEVVAQGESSSKAKPAALQAARSTVQGVQGVMVTTGAGDLRSQSTRVYSMGLVTAVGEGSLSVADSSKVIAAGSGGSRGIGALRSTSPTVEGSGKTLAQGTGELVAPARKITATGGRVLWAGSGELVAQDREATGTGVSQSRGSGVLRVADPARVAGVGTASVSGAGALKAGAAKVTAVAILTTQGFGVLAANDNVIVGKGDQRSTGFGWLNQGRGTLEAEIVSGSEGQGEIIARKALMLGFGSETAYGDGVLVSTDAVIDASNLVEGAGVIEAGASEIVGIGETGWPVLRAPDPMPGSYPGTAMWRGSTTGPTLPPPPWWLRAA